MSDDITIPSPTYRVPRHRRGMDPAAKRRVMIAAGLFGTLVVVGGGWAMLGHRHHGVPVVQADAGPVRVKPTNPGGLQVPSANNEIFSGGSDTSVDKLAPPPEAPDLKALRAPPAPAEKPAEAATLATEPPPPPTPPIVQAIQTPKPAVAPAAPAEPKPVVAAAAPPAPKPVVTTATIEHHAPTPAHAGKNALVQLAALSSEQAAKTEWEHLAKRMPDLLAGKRPAFSKIEHDGHTFWRVRTGGFDDAAQAALFCVRLRAKGANCSVADF